MAYSTENLASCRWCRETIVRRSRGQRIDWIHAINNRFWCDGEEHHAEPGIEFNVNDKVLVRLSPYGLQMWAAYWSETHPGGVPQSILTAARRPDGWFSFQMWELLHIFGHGVYLGSFPLPFDTTIRLEEKQA